MAGIMRCIWDGREVIDFDLDDFRIVELMLEEDDTIETRAEVYRQLRAIGYSEDRVAKMVVKVRQELGSQEKHG
jgi:hypothetical protein